MGLAETSARPLFVPETERVQQIRDQLTEDFTHILTLGGLVTGNGTEITQPSGTVIDMLSPELAAQAEKQRVLKLNRSHIKVPLGAHVPLKSLSSTRFYLFTPDAIEGLAYQESRSGNIMPQFVNTDRSITLPHTYDNHFAQFFASRVKRVIRHEEIGGSYYRFAARILKDVSNDKGLGLISGKKAQDYIREHKTR